MTIYLMMSIPSTFLLLLVLFSSDVTFESGGKLSFISSLLIQLLVTSFLVYIIIKLNKSDKKLRLESGTDLNLSFTIPKDTIINHATEKTFRKDGKVIKRIKIGWFYAPDKTEEWLEDMEMKGYNLYRMSRLGNTFYFTKGEPRKVKYCLDFQSAVNDSYFEIHKSNGWKLIFTSLSNSSKYTLWGKEYSDEKPELYSDKIHILKHARKQCRLYCILYIPMIIMYLCLFGLNIIMYSKGFQMSLMLIVVFSVCIVEFGYFVLTSLGYYLRIRKKLSY